MFVENAAEYGLEPGIETEYGEIYSVALYHQMHCLGLVRRNFWRLVEGILNNRPGVVDDARAEVQNSHTGHCFDYFRQSFECSASAALKSNHFKQSVKQIKQISKKFISNKQIPILRFDLTFDMFDAALSLPWQTW